MKFPIFLILPLYALLSYAFDARASDCNLSGKGELPTERLSKFQTLSPDIPDHAAIQFDVAAAYAKAGNTGRALSLLRDALTDTPWLDPSSEQVFTPLFGCAAFQELVARVQHKYPAVSEGCVVFTIPQKDLIPEGLAADTNDGSLYLSSIFHRKILKIKPDGAVSDFVTEAQDGLLGVLDVKVDPRNGSVWAASALRGRSALFHFDRNGKTLHQYVPKTPGKHEFNDLVITSVGDILVTDDLDNAVYRLRHDTSDLVRIDLGNRSYPNGIALREDETGVKNGVYVAYSFGIVFMDLNRIGIIELQKPKDVSLAQVDGLYFRRGSLIAIQNAFGGNRIAQVLLAPEGKSVLSGKLLEFRSPNLVLPTYRRNLSGQLLLHREQSDRS